MRKANETKKIYAAVVAFEYNLVGMESETQAFGEKRPNRHKSALQNFTVMMQKNKIIAIT
jgi:hypothetical protein